MKDNPVVKTKQAFLNNIACLFCIKVGNYNIVGVGRVLELRNVYIIYITLNAHICLNE